MIAVSPNVQLKQKEESDGLLRVALHRAARVVVLAVGRIDMNPIDEFNFLFASRAQWVSVVVAAGGEDGLAETRRGAFVSKLRCATAGSKRT
jgi:hypothetical protein